MRVADRFLKKNHRGGLAICPDGNEAYPLAVGTLCLGCQCEDLYVVLGEEKTEADLWSVIVCSIELPEIEGPVRKSGV